MRKMVLVLTLMVAMAAGAFPAASSFAGEYEAPDAYSELMVMGWLGDEAGLEFNLSGVHGWLQAFWLKDRKTLIVRGLLLSRGENKKVEPNRVYIAIDAASGLAVYGVTSGALTAELTKRMLIDRNGRDSDSEGNVVPAGPKDWHDDLRMRSEYAEIAPFTIFGISDFYIVGAYQYSKRFKDLIAFLQSDEYKKHSTRQLAALDGEKDQEPQDRAVDKEIAQDLLGVIGRVDSVDLLKNVKVAKVFNDMRRDRDNPGWGVVVNILTAGTSGMLTKSFTKPNVHAMVVGLLNDLQSVKIQKKIAEALRDDRPYYLNEVD